MAFTVGNPILASELIAIKARVKAEMLRRNQVGSLVEYGGSDYDYTVTPAAGNPVLPEHFNKLIIPMNAMVDTGLTTVSSGEPIPALDGLVTKLTEAEEYTISGNSTNCKASCSGLCVGTCKTACGSACSGSCSGSCTDSCTGGCENGCTGNCKGGCSKTCKTDCAVQCGNSCKDSCTVGCSYGCRGTCQGSLTHD